MKDKRLTEVLVNMDPVDINVHALGLLLQLLERCTIHLVSDLTGITRPTLYRWLDTDRPYEDMDHIRAAWFVMHCENNPKVKLLLSRAPLSHPRMAKQLLGD